MNLQAYAARHAQTLLGSLGRLVAHPLASLMTMSVIAVALALPLCLELFLQNVGVIAAEWNDAFEISVYLDKSASGSRAQAIAEELKRRADVAAVRVVTAEQAFAEFRLSSGYGQALDALAENPLPATLIVTPSLAASTTAGTSALKTAIGAIADVGTVQLDTEWVMRLVALLDLLRRVVRLTGALLAIGVLVVVGNTIRLDIFNRRAEIEVMKLVGATDGFTRRPFLWTGIWYGLGGGIIAIVLVSLGAVLVAGPVARVAALYGSAFRLEGLAWHTALGVILAAAALGWLGSWIAASHHLHAIQPT